MVPTSNHRPDASVLATRHGLLAMSASSTNGAAGTSAYEHQARRAPVIGGDHTERRCEGAPRHCGIGAAELQCWQAFGRRAFEQGGVVSVLSIRMYIEHDAELVAGLNLYSREVAAFCGISQTLGTLLATHGALAVSNASAREKAENLTKALYASRDVVGGSYVAA